MTDVSVVDDLAELDLDGQKLRSALDDEIDLSVAAPGSQMTDSGLGGLGIDPDAKGDERFEQCPQERPVARYGRAGGLCVEEGAGVDFEKLGCERRVGEVVLGR